VADCGDVFRVIWLKIVEQDVRRCMKNEQITIARKVMEEDREAMGRLSDRISVIWYHPFNFVGIKKPKFEHPSDDTYEYGFSLDLTTEIYYYTYDWGYGFRLRILGFGFDLVLICNSF
jgi:hypothetical protein